MIVTKWGISLWIVQKRRRRIKTPKKAHPREIDQDTRSKPFGVLVPVWQSKKGRYPSCHH